MSRDVRLYEHLDASELVIDLSRNLFLIEFNELYLMMSLDFFYNSHINLPENAKYHPESLFIENLMIS